MQDFDTAEVHAARAYALDPQDPARPARLRPPSISARADRAAAAMAEGVLAETPANVLAHSVLVADRLAAQATGALARVDAGLAAVPSEEGPHLARLALPSNGARTPPSAPSSPR